MSLATRQNNVLNTLLASFILFLILGLSFWLRKQYMWVQPFGYDQRTNLMFAVLSARGATPYTDLFMGIPPLALWIVRLGIHFWGVDLAARYPTILISLVGIVSLFWIFRPWQNRFNLLVGSIASTLLAFEFFYFLLSVSLIAEAPAMAIALLSLALMYEYYHREGKPKSESGLLFSASLIWVFLSGIAFAASLGFKLFVLFLPGPIFILIFIAAWGNLRRGLIGGAVWGLGVIIPVLGMAAVYDAPHLFQEIFLFRLQLRATYLAGGMIPPGNGLLLWQMFAQYPLLIVMGGIGIGISWGRHPTHTWVWLSWLILSLLLLISHAPLRDRYIVLAIPALVVFSSLAITHLVHRLWHIRAMRGGRVIAVFVVAVFLLWSSASSIQNAFAARLKDTFLDQNLAAVRYAWQHSMPADCLISDDPSFNFSANRLPPPALAETSRARIMAGLLTVDEIAAQINLYHCPMVVYAGDIFNHHLPALQGRLQDLFYLTIIFDDVAIFTANKQAEPTPQIPLAHRFENSLTLQGIDLTPQAWYPGQEGRLGLYWQTIRPPETAYKVFIHLRNRQQETIVNFDHYPFPVPQAANYEVVPNINYERFSPEAINLYPARGMLPTNSWPEQSAIRYVIPIKLPASLAPGMYSLYAGLYDETTAERVSIQTDHGTTFELFLTPIEVIELRP